MFLMFLPIYLYSFSSTVFVCCDEHRTRAAFLCMLFGNIGFGREAYLLRQRPHRAASTPSLKVIDGYQTANRPLTDVAEFSNPTAVPLRHSKCQPSSTLRSETLSESCVSERERERDHDALSKLLSEWWLSVLWLSELTQCWPQALTAAHLTPRWSKKCYLKRQVPTLVV